MTYPQKTGDLAVVISSLLVLTAVFHLATTTVRAQEGKWRELGEEAWALTRAGKGDAALAKLKEAAQLAEQALGPDHPDVAAPLLGMANLLEVSVKVDEAEPLYQRGFAILEKALGAEHARTFSAMYAYAEILARQGKHALAEPLFERTLANWEKTAQAENRISSLSGQLARVYEAQAKYAQAEPLLERILGIEERRLGMSNTSLIYPLMNLAGNYVDQAKYDKAEPLYWRLLAIEESAKRQRVEVALPLTALAVLYSRQGRYGEAEKLLYRALRHREKTQGAQSVGVTNALDNLAALYVAQFRYREAEPLYLRSLKIVEKAVEKREPEHPYYRHLANLLEEMAALYRKTNREAKAQGLEKRIAAIRLKVHPEPAISFPKNWLQELR
jgi:tetratricopeptide (TPR) repeat protein